jgi:hypothetical protein
MRSWRSVVILLSVAALFAQDFRATLTGRITDPAGAGVAGAKVEVKNTQNGEVTVATSQDDGAYLVQFLTPGDYVISVEKPGFKKIVREGVHLDVAQRGVADIAMSLGQVDQSVTVSAATEQLETEAADRGLTVESTRVINTPLQGRNIMAQAWSAPGVMVTGSVTRLRPFDIAGSSGISVNGGRPGTNEILVDGITSLSQASSASYIPTAEATGEFRVQNTNFDAQYGLTLGGVINIITKNGTNAFHGSLFEFLQNTHFNANTFNSNRTGTPRSSSHINTFGGDVSGPIIKNKLFFSYTYEDIRQVIPDPFTTSVPTALQKNGDFSQTYYSSNSSGKLLTTIYDPLTTTTNASGAIVRTPFAGNVIPSSRINPVAAKVLSYVPGGNVAGDSVTSLNNLTNNSSTRKFTDFFPEHTGRVDWDLNDSTRMFARYSRNALTEARGFHYSTTSATNPADTTNNNPFTRENHNAIVQLTHTFSPTMILDVRTGLERFKSESGDLQGAGVGASDLGFANQFVSQAADTFPKFNWSGYEGAGAQPTYIGSLYQANTVEMMLAKTLGKHNVKFGADLRLLRGYSPNPGYNAGNFTFDKIFTGANALSSDSASGNSIASFLLGTPASGYIQQNSQPARQEKMYSLYVQDDVRLTSRLKVNLGLRWDYIAPLTDRFNELGRGFNPQAAVPLTVSGMSLNGGILFAGVNGQPRGIFDANPHNFGPRVGAAYQLSSKTVVRGGYALVMGQTWYDPGNALGFSQTTNMVTSVVTGQPYNTLTNPFPDGVSQPSGASKGYLTGLGNSFQFADPEGGSPPYVHQFSVEIQHQLPGNFLVSGAYVGSRARRIAVTQQLNGLSLSSLALGSSALTKSATNPFAGMIPGTSLNAATVQQQQLLAPYPQFLVATGFNAATSGGILEMYEPIGKSSYNALQLLVSKRLSHGLNFSVSYTYSKQMDQVNYDNPTDTRLEKVVAAWDVPQTLQINMVYELPFGTGKALGAKLPSPVRYAVSGWTISSLTRLQQGMPMSFPSNAVPTGLNPTVSDPNYTRWFNTCTLLLSGATTGCVGSDQPVWMIRQAYSLQTWSSRLSSVRLPGIHNSDISVMKHNRLSERLDLIFRADLINAFNSPQFFNGPTTDATSGNFGKISGASDQSNLPRFVQLSLKLQF